MISFPAKELGRPQVGDVVAFVTTTAGRERPTVGTITEVNGNECTIDAQGVIYIRWVPEVLVLARPGAESEGEPGETKSVQLEVRLTNFELLRVLGGNPMTCRSVEGQIVVVRLPTADEVMETVARVQEEMDMPEAARPVMTRLMAEQLTRPFNV